MATKKGVLSNGTAVWIVHGAVPTLTKMGCIKALALGDDSAAEINTTCLEETSTATTEYGLVTPGEGSVQIDTDPKNQSHIFLKQFILRLMSHFSQRFKAQVKFHLKLWM